jgi:hypothetical protein
VSWRRALLIVGVALAVTYELLAAFGANDPTISEIIWTANRHPIVPFLFGVVAGHLFWSHERQ